jgi:hypothetical protein
MKTFSEVLTIAIIVMASTFAASAQNSGDNNNMNVNANYKHQVPVSKGNKLKDSFKNDQMVDMSGHNYKQPKYKKEKKTAFKDNFSNVQKASTVNSKHPYGL